MASVVYALCALTSALCAVLLWRAYRASRARLLLWSSLSFIGLACNNLLLFVDLVVVPTVDLALYRGLISAVSVMVLLLGLIWDSN
jgi:hydrogenase/urease accessory protein HupE